MKFQRHARSLEIKSMKFQKLTMSSPHRVRLDAIVLELREDVIAGPARFVVDDFEIANMTYCRGQSEVIGLVVVARMLGAQVPSL
eukprot:760614-Amorphochlora_amoeboformis.AAC.1